MVSEDEMWLELEDKTHAILEGKINMAENSLLLELSAENLVHGSCLLFFRFQ